MKTNKSYFSHDSNARNSDKLLKVRMDLGAEGYAIYFMILERLREEDDYISKNDYMMIAYDLRVDEEKVKKVINDYDLFIVDDDVFYSKSFMERMTIKVTIISILHLLMHMQNSNLKHRGEYGQPIQ